MDAPQFQRAQMAWINELLHRMTLANTTDVRMQLCVEAKKAIAELVEPNADRDPFAEETQALIAASKALNIYALMELREMAESLAAARKEPVGFKG